MGRRGARIGAALGLPVMVAGGVIGALALAGPSDAAHGPASHVLTPTAATNTTTSTAATPPAPSPGPATAANSSPPTSTTTTTVAPSPPAPAIGAPANSTCGGVCGPANSGTSSSSGNGQ